MSNSSVGSFDNCFDINDHENKVNTSQNLAADDFDEYMWMGEEDADEKILKELEEQELSTICHQNMLEQNSDSSNYTPAAADVSVKNWSTQQYPVNEQSDAASAASPAVLTDCALAGQLSQLKVKETQKCLLNPLAAEFVPRCRARTLPPKESTVPLQPSVSSCPPTAVSDNLIRN